MCYDYTESVPTMHVCTCVMKWKGEIDKDTRRQQPCRKKKKREMSLESRGIRVGGDVVETLGDEDKLAGGDLVKIDKIRSSNERLG